MNTASPYSRFRIILIASLCLNLLLLGAAGAVVLRWRFQPGAQIYRAEMRQLTRRLDHQDAQLVRSTFSGHRAQILAAAVDYRRSLKVVVAALQESPRNEDKVQKAIRDARASQAALGERTFDVLLTSLQNISPQGRDALLKAQK